MFRSFFALCAALLISASLAVPALAVEPDEVMKDPAMEKRARVISKDLRCLVCQNQSIDDSNADLAKDLRVLVRERLSKGDSNNQVIDYIVARYGEYVLLKPRMAPHTWAMWFAGPLVLLLGIFGLVTAYRRRRAAPAAAKPAPALSEDEARRLDDLMNPGAK
ncbi:MAG: cytochrome C biogenesis protein CcmH [Hyphomicrobiales bacterium]|nr:MAG: cytochrome C biogenesis protein CcmH [Hyphomicrobiales bacterium]